MAVQALRISIVLDIIEERFGLKFTRALVVGCGNGAEAFAIAERFNCEVVGLDISPDLFLGRSDARVTLTVGDAAALPFPDQHFDLLYSFHSLEHIERLDEALKEMRRVLTPSGSVFVGTPNKSRALGYFGSHAPLKAKIMWNLQDWKMRLLGKWRNPLAHAGFTRAELSDLVYGTFGQASDQTLSYYTRLYASRRRDIVAFDSLGLGKFFFPAVYASN